MTDDYDQVFGRRPIVTPPSFAERVGRTQQAAPQPMPPAMPEGASASGPYRPYGHLPAGNMGEACEVVRWIDGTEIPEGIDFQYRFLMQVGFVGDEQLKLFLPDCIVVIEGRRLAELRRKLARRMVTFICQHNPRVWPERPSSTEPIIERIEVVRP